MDMMNKPLEKWNELEFLQWSHDLSAMDICVSLVYHSSFEKSFNGAMTFQPWI